MRNCLPFLVREYEVSRPRPLQWECRKGAIVVALGIVDGSFPLRFGPVVVGRIIFFRKRIYIFQLDNRFDIPGGGGLLLLLLLLLLLHLSVVGRVVGRVVVIAGGTVATARATARAIVFVGVAVAVNLGVLLCRF